MPKNGKCLRALLSVIVAIVVMAPVNAGAQSTQAQVKKQVRTLEGKAHKSQSVINFFNNKGRWALYLHREKCWYVSVPEGRKTCTRARRLVAYHAKRLKAVQSKIAKLLQPRDTGYLPPDQARELGRKMAAQRGWTGQQWLCLDTLWGDLESSWEPHKYNLAGSGAYGIPQASPAHKMSSAGNNWRDSAFVQIKWGLGYIAGKFKTPCNALSYHYAHNSY